jgi:hypothetical protein
MRSRAKLADQQRAQFTNDLRRQLPFILLWLESGQAHGIRNIGNSPAVANNGAEFWVVPQTTSMNELLPQLFEGSWGMFFFVRRPEPLPSPPVPLLPEETNAADPLRLTGAQVAILSDPDDVDWLVLGDLSA